MDSKRYQFTFDSTIPVFTVEPHQTRMATCYQDNAGVYHLFADYMEVSKISWNASIRYYTSSNLIDWNYSSTAVEKGDKGSMDDYGTASPHVFATSSRVYLFYAGRSCMDKNNADSSAKKGEKGYINGHIMMASSKVDSNGAPLGKFEKHGVLLSKNDEWDSMRQDDPCLVINGNKAFLYFKGFQDNQDLNKVKVGCATADLEKMEFEKLPEPIMSVSGGGEMPRVFRDKNNWNMFYHHFNSDGAIWQHHVSENGIDWLLHDPDLFSGHSECGPKDIMMVYGMNGNLIQNPKVFVAGEEKGYNKIWLYSILEKKQLNY